MLSQQQVQYILILFELKHFSRAAAACFVTQPTLSMQLKKAEESLGFVIFDRDKNPLELTLSGEKLLPILRELASDYEEINRIKKEISGDFQQEIRIGIIPTISAYLIPTMYSKWQDLFPAIRLVIEETKSEAILENLRNKKIDLGILAGPIEDEQFKVIKLFDEEIKAYLPFQNSNEVEITLLKTLNPWLLNKGNCLRNQMIRFCELENNNQQQWNFEGGNIEMLIRMVDLKGGYTLIPDNYRKIMKESEIHFKSISTELKEYPSRSVFGVVPNKNTKWQTLQKFIRTIQHEFNEMATNDKKLITLAWK